MIKNSFKISVNDIAIAIANAIDLVNARINGHNKRVAYIAGEIASLMDLSIEKRTRIIFAGYLHDVGVIGVNDKDKLFLEDNEDNEHAEIGYRLLRAIPELKDIALMVKRHHRDYIPSEKVPNKEERLNNCNYQLEKLGGEILYVADRIDVMFTSNKDPLAQKTKIVQWIKDRANVRFNPEVVEAFTVLAKREAFWFDLHSPFLEDIIHKNIANQHLELDIQGLDRIGKLFSQIIDFRSRFTATHSSGVAAVAAALAECIGFSQREQGLMRIAGYLHDLGKLAVPTEILEKNDSLSSMEFNVMRSHTYYTYRILERIQGFGEIAAWAGYHHEKLNGSGYPFKLHADQLSLGSRIMAVADIFSALVEDRPYRNGFNKEKTAKVLYQMVENGSIDSEIVDRTILNFERLKKICHEAQMKALEEYERFWYN